MKYRLLFNKLNIETFSECKNLVHIIDSILMSAHKINNIKDFTYQSYGNGRGSNVEVYYKNNLIEIIEVVAC